MVLSTLLVLSDSILNKQPPQLDKTGPIAGIAGMLGLSQLPITHRAVQECTNSKQPFID